MEARKSYAVGHFALGYVLSKAAAKLTKTEITLPLVLTLSVIPDVDMLIPFLEHRGPAHSLLITLAVFMPVFAVHGKRAIPYFCALAQHSLIGDFTVGKRVQLLWPLTTQYYGVQINIKGSTNIALEWTMFASSMILMIGTEEITMLFKPRSLNLILAVPTFAVLLPALLSFPIDVPSQLVTPHLIYILLFLASLTTEAASLLKRRKPHRQKTR